MFPFASATNQDGSSLLAIFMAVTCADTEMAMRRLCYTAKLMSSLRSGQTLKLKQNSKLHLIKEDTCVLALKISEKKKSIMICLVFIITLKHLCYVIFPLLPPSLSYRG